MLFKNLYIFCFSKYFLFGVDYIYLMIIHQVASSLLSSNFVNLKKIICSIGIGQKYYCQFSTLVGISIQQCHVCLYIVMYILTYIMYLPWTKKGQDLNYFLFLTLTKNAGKQDQFSFLPVLFVANSLYFKVYDLPFKNKIYRRNCFFSVVLSRKNICLIKKSYLYLYRQYYPSVYLKISSNWFSRCSCIIGFSLESIVLKLAKLV